VSAPVYPIDGSPFESGEQILWWLRPAGSDSRRGYLLQRFTRALVAFTVAAVALALTFTVALPLLRLIPRDLSMGALALLAGTGVVTAAGVLLAVVGLLSLLVPEPACPPRPRVVADLLYVITDRRVLVMRASRGSGRAYQPDDLAPAGAAPPTYRIDEVAPGVGNVLIGVPGPAGWIPRMALWRVPEPDLVVDRLRAWTEGEVPDAAADLSDSPPDAWRRRPAC
jgi:hypothetical protein